MYMDLKPLGSSEECPDRVLHLERKDFPYKSLRDILEMAEGSATPDYEGRGKFATDKIIWFVRTCEPGVLRSNTEHAFEESLEAWNADPGSFDRNVQPKDPFDD